MASKHDTRHLSTVSNKEIEELLHQLTKQTDRLKVMYEQYFMGIQKVPPAQLHRDVERRLRELTQLNIRNTALRFRLANIKQKYGSYNSYWKRTMRQIEQGTYLPHIKALARKASRLNQEIPAEILAAMPKRVREKIVRDRERMQRLEQRKQAGKQTGGRVKAPAEADTPEWRKETAIAEDELGDFNLMDMNDDFDLDDAFGSIMAEADKAVTKHSEPKASAPPPPTPAAAKPTPRPTPRSTPKAASVPRPTQSKSPAKRPAPRPASRPAPRPARAAGGDSPIPGMTKKQTQDLHKRYNQGQQMVGGGKPVSYDQLMKTLKRQAPKILKQHSAKGVTFNVAIKGDKVILKAKPKK